MIPHNYSWGDWAGMEGYCKHLLGLMSVSEVSGLCNGKANVVVAELERRLAERGVYLSPAVKEALPAVARNLQGCEWLG